jgi:CheY-like chemotaxis protein
MIQIPAQQDTDTAPESLTRPTDPGETVTRILYIEDNHANIEVVARFLRSRPNLRLQSIVSGQAGLEFAIREVPDLILLDLHLPELRGDEVLRQLRAAPATADIPVAILSAEAAPAVIRDMRGRGVIAYLTKPLDLTELGQLIDSFVAGHDHETGAASGTVPT